MSLSSPTTKIPRPQTSQSQRKHVDQVDPGTHGQDTTTQRSDSPREMKALASLVNRALAEAQQEQDLVSREKLFSLASVMLDALSNCRRAEKSMLEAQQAAATAKSSYEMTQRSVLEMGRLMDNKMHGVPAFLRKLAVRSSGIHQ